ncbi:MAG: ParB/RepB/Spo0J family partition protein [Paracoccaceae bacterium]
MAKEKKRGLGRGLSALMADVAEAENPAVSPATVGVQSLPIEQVQPNPEQPRKRFEQEHLDDLSASIREKGIIQPLIVRAVGDIYEIVAGERRWRAAQQAQLHEVPVVVREFSDTEVLEVAIIENIQRADLNPVEEAMGYRALMEKFGHTQERMAEALGKSRSYIANLLRLLQLPRDVIDWLEEGKLTIGHARALITADDPTSLAKDVIKKGLSVRETEALVKKGQSSQGGAPFAVPKGAAPAKDADTRALEDDLAAALGLKVSLTHGASGEKGSLTLHYSSLEQLDELCRKLSGT